MENNVIKMFWCGFLEIFLLTDTKLMRNVRFVSQTFSFIKLTLEFCKRKYLDKHVFLNLLNI